MKGSFCFKLFSENVLELSEGFPSKKKGLCTDIYAKSHIVGCFYVLASRNQVIALTMTLHELTFEDCLKIQKCH